MSFAVSVISVTGAFYLLFRQLPIEDIERTLHDLFFNQSWQDQLEEYKQEHFPNALLTSRYDFVRYLEQMDGVLQEMRRCQEADGGWMERYKRLVIIQQRRREQVEELNKLKDQRAVTWELKYRSNNSIASLYENTEQRLKMIEMINESIKTHDPKIDDGDNRKWFW